VIKEKTVLAVIPARGGSKGVPRKNIRNIAGKPLIAWTITAAKCSQYIDRLILSSDDAEIISVAVEWGCEVPFVRPADLARDDTPGIEPVLHAIQALPEKYDYCVLLQPTSPLRSVNDIDGCIEIAVEKQANVCVSVTKAAENPYWMFSRDAHGRLKPFVQTPYQYVRRQDLPPVYIVNGAVYVAKCDWLLHHKSFITYETNSYVMPSERSLDIDSELDLKFVHFLLGQGRD